METLCIYFVFSFISLTFGSPHVAQYEIKDGKKKDNSFDDMLHRLHNFGTIEKETIARGPVKLKTFHFTDCGVPSALGHVTSFSVTPDPLVMPGPLDVEASMKINSPLQSPLMGDVVIEREVLGRFVRVPCIDNFGSCKYQDLCVLLEQVQCPEPFVMIGIDCKCPFKAGTYKLPKTEFQIEAAILPAGLYHVAFNTTHLGHQGFCIKLVIEIN